MRRKFTGGTAALSDLKTVEGIYDGSKDIELSDGRTTRIHTFRAKSGEALDLYGFGWIDFALQKLQGKYVWLTYTGLKERPTRYGIREVHTADVEWDEEDSAARSAPGQSKRRR